MDESLTKIKIRIKKEAVPELMQELVEDLMDACVDYGFGQHMHCASETCIPHQTLNDAAEKLYNAISMLLEKKK